MIKSHILTLLSCLTGLLAFSQTIEFVENKGQWDPRTRYIGQINNGAFFINNDGFKVLQHNAADLKKVQELSHARMRGKEDEEVILHSHAYEVQFVGSNPKARIATGV